MVEIVDKAIRTGLLRDLPSDFYIVMIAQILFGLLTFISSRTTDLPDDDLIAASLDMIWKH